MRWFSAMIVGNISRGKLGMRLHKQNKSLMYSSSDAFCLNAFEVMLEICLKFLDRDSKLVSDRKLKFRFQIYQRSKSE